MTDKEFENSKIEIVLSHITNTVDKLHEKQDEMAETLVRTTTILEMQQKQHSKIEESIGNVAQVVEKVSHKVDEVANDTGSHTERIAVLEKTAYTFSSIPMVFKFIALILTIITSSFGVYALVKGI